MTAVDSSVRVDAGALSASVRNEAFQRVAQAVTTARVALADQGNRLNELQEAALVEHVLGAFDGFERSVADELVRTFKANGVEVWGLPRAFEVRDA
jgi:hypothetical protein